MTKNIIKSTLAGLVAISATSFSAVSFADVNVKIDLKDANHHYAYVDIALPKSIKKSVRLKLPTWRTGRYSILPLADGIRGFDAKNGSKSLTWNKIDKSTWEISGDLSDGIQVNYQVYANELGLRTRHIDDSHAYLDASAVIMYSDETRDDKHIIDLNVPKAWRSVSGLEPGKTPHQFIAKDYDVLVDSPIETGINEFHEFKVNGVDYELVIWGKGNYDSEQMVKDLKKLVTQGSSIWPQDYPFSRYVFMVHATSGARGATEHLNSTIIQRSRFKFSERKDYLEFLSTAAHEFVHTWNVKQYRPEGLVPYNYQSENYSNLIWLSEGSTSYLQNQLLMRGDLMTADEWLKNLSKRITGYIHKPGRQSQSVAESSFDTWIGQGGDYGKNHSVNIYSEGFLVSWLLDFDLLEATKLERSYRDVHNSLYEEYRIPKTFNDKDMLSILKNVSGKDYTQWWNANVDGLANPDFNVLLEKAGLKMSYGKKNETKAWTGISTKVHSNGLEITSVEKGSPAWQAGFTIQDIIVAVDGLRMGDKDLSTRLKNFKSEQSVEFTMFRRDQLITKTIKLGTTPKEKLKIVAMKNATDDQKAFFTAWTGLDFPLKDKKDKN